MDNDEKKPTASDSVNAENKYSRPISYSESSMPASKIHNKGLFIYFDKNRRKITIASAAIFIAILTGAAYLVISNYSQNPSEDKAEQVVTEEGVALKQLSDDELRDKLNQLIFEKKYKSAEELIMFQEGTERHELQVMLASVYMNQEKYSDALRVYQQMSEDNPQDWRAYNYLGDTYDKLDDKNQAMSNYNKAVQLLENADSREDKIQKRRIETKIKRLERQL